MIHAPPFKRKLILEELINKGESIEGIKGLVPSDIQCCTGTTKVYIPVVVEQVKLGDCSFRVIVQAIKGNGIVVAPEGSFSINPQKFFQSTKEVLEYEQYKTVRDLFKNECRVFEYGAGTPLTKLRTKFREALEQTSKDLREQILAEISDKDEGIKTAKREWMQPWFKKMMLLKYFPNYNEEDEDDENEYYEDN